MPFCCCFCFISEVIVCLFSFSFLDYVQIKGTKIIYSVLSWSEILQEGEFLTESNLILQLVKDIVG